MESLVTPKYTQRYLVAYSAAVTVAFMLTVYFGFVRPVHGASNTTEFDRIRAHRIDLVEPDGTQRLILSNRADFPGSFYHRKEIARPDRSDSAGMIFLDDEGTEDGGLIFDGALVKGKASSHGHLSFDQYDQDQTLALDEGLEDGEKYSQIVLGSQPDFALSPEVVNQFAMIKAMPEGPAKQKAWADVKKKYPYGPYRVILRTASDKSAGLTLNDTQGHPRLRVAVGVDGSPSIQMLAADGKVLKTIDAK